MNKIITSFLLLAGLATAVSSCKDDNGKDDPKPSNMMTISANMNAANTPSTTAQPGPVMSSGTGTVSGTYNKDTSVLTYSITYSGLTGPVTRGHFHIGGPTEVTMEIPVSFTNVQTSPITGTATLTPALADELLKGRIYANLHTDKYKQGEIRAQVAVK